MSKKERHKHLSEYVFSIRFISFKILYIQRKHTKQMSSKLKNEITYLGEKNFI